MRWLGMLAALFVLLATVIGVSALRAFGYGAWEIVGLLWPVALGVAAFSVALFYFGWWSVRRLNRSDDPRREDARRD